MQPATGLDGDGGNGAGGDGDGPDLSVFADDEHVVALEPCAGGAKRGGAGIKPRLATTVGVDGDDAAIGAGDDLATGADADPANLAERWLGGRRTDALIAVSGAEWAEAGRLGIAEARRHLIPNRLSDFEHRPRAEARAALGAGEEDIWLGFVGRLCAQKAPLEFVAAAIGAMRRCARVRALILGDGELASLVEQAIAASGFAERFAWHRDADAREWIAAIDLLVVTSRYEGLPYAMLEALAAGVPVLSTPVGGAHDLLGGGAGVVAPAEGLPGKLLALISRPAKLERLRASATKAGEACRGEQMIDRTEALYRSVARGE